MLIVAALILSQFLLGVDLQDERGFSEFRTPPTSPMKEFKEHKVAWTEGFECGPNFKGAEPIKLQLYSHLVRTRSKLCAIVPLFKGLDSKKIKVFITGRSIVVNYYRTFPKKWWNPAKLYPSKSYGMDAIVWQRAFAETHFSQPCATEARLEIELNCIARIVAKSVVLSNKEAYMHIYMEEVDA